MKTYRAANPEKIRERKRSDNRTDKAHERGARYRATENWKQLRRANDHQKAADLSDAYIKRVLHQSGVPYSLVNDDLVKLKRDQLSLSRGIRELSAQVA